MNTLFRFLRGAHSLVRLVLLPTEILLGILLNQYAMRFTKAGREAESELQRSSDRDSRFTQWVGEEYPEFSLEHCPVDPEDPNFDFLHSEWIEQIRDMNLDFDSLEEENGIFIQPSLKTDSSSNLTQWGVIKGKLESVFYIGLLVGYTYLVVAAVWFSAKYFLSFSDFV
jgi:hypothetical protein